MPIHQLIYTSRATGEVTDQVLFEILGLSQVRNFKQKISGVLIFHKGAYIQLLEGSAHDVKDIFSSILKDSRHTDIKVVFENDSPARCMPSWFMGFCTSMEMTIQFREQNFFIPIDEIREICGLMTGDVGEILQKFLNS